MANDINTAGTQYFVDVLPLCIKQGDKHRISSGQFAHILQNSADPGIITMQLGRLQLNYQTGKRCIHGNGRD